MGTETKAAPGTDLKNVVNVAPVHTPHPLPRRRQILWFGVLGWTALVGLALWWLVKGNGGPSVWVFQERDLHQPGFSEKVQAMFRGELGLQRIYPWILFGPFLALMAWHFPLERERLRRNLPLNVAACLTFAWACQTLDLGTRVTRANVVVVSSGQALGGGIVPFRTARLVPPGRTSTAVGSSGHDEPFQPMPSPGDFRPAVPPPRSSKVSLRSAILDLLAYGAISGLVHSVNFYGRLRERERRALVLESNLAKARLNMLKAQLQPHFLFNSLNAIATLMRRDPRLAETTLVALSELLRLTLSQSEKQEGSLREELEFVRRYLEIQQTRFGEKLRVEQDIDPQALECTVPTLVLQPLMENAIRHGIEPGDKPGVVRVSAARQDGNLILTVEDYGVGLASGFADSNVREHPPGLVPGLPAPARSSTTSALPAGAGTGIGLANLRDRLRALYGDGQKLELTPRAAGGVAVRVEIPWKSRGSSETTNSFDA